MSDFGDGKWIVGRKPHRCDACYGPIPEGERHFNYRGMWEGEWQNWRMHEECHAVWDTDDCGEFSAGDFEMPERVRLLARGAAC